MKRKRGDSRVFTRTSSRGVFMLDQKSSVFGDKRTKRQRTRGDQKRRAIEEGK